MVSDDDNDGNDDDKCDGNDGDSGDNNDDDGNDDTAPKHSAIKTRRGLSKLV